MNCLYSLLHSFQNKGGAHSMAFIRKAQWFWMSLPSSLLQGSKGTPEVKKDTFFSAVK